MMHAIPPRQDQSEATVPPSQSMEDYYSALVQVIVEASNDPARLRRLVYAVARSKLDPEAIFAKAVPNAIDQAKTLTELERAFQLEQAIRRLELQSAPLADLVMASADEADVAPPPEPDWAPATASTPRFAESPAPEPIPDLAASGLPVAMPQPVRRWAPPSADATAEPHPAWLSGATGDSIEFNKTTPAQRRWAAWRTLPIHVHVVAAALVAATLITGVSVLIQRGRGGAVETAETKLPAPAVSVAHKGSKIAEGTGQDGPQTTGSAGDQSFPMPRSFGVYAANNGLLTQLDQLPVPIAAERLRASAEITRPSRTTLPGDRLSFIVFDRDFANSAPQNVSVRVVGRVSRLVRYVDGRVKVTPTAGAWRVRDRSYEFKASPLEGRDILVIRPDAETVLPAGRYALVLNGRGYDFTVAGQVTAPEQCLEQTEVVNGVVVGDCTNL